MNTSKILLMLAGLNIAAIQAQAQTSERAIPTAMSFLLLHPDARSSAMGDVGAATSADAYSLYSNPSKSAFSDQQIEVSLSYTPLMRNLVKDVNLVNFSGFKKMDERNTIGLSVYYLSYGKIDLTDDNGVFIQSYFPVEYTIDFTFARKMADNFSLALTGRYLQSSTRFNESNNNLVADPASAFATDISMYYQKPISGGMKDAQLALGAMISNIGTKMHYQNSRADFLPTNLKLGAAYGFQINNSMQRLSFSIDLNKLLVPTPPVYGANGEIVDGKDPNRSVVGSLFSSFGDAPGGFSEELSEFNVGTGLEYLYNEKFAIRTGYFYESPKKGNRQHFTLGAGVKHKDLSFDLAYILPTSNRFVLKNNIKFSLGYRFN